MLTKDELLQKGVSEEAADEIIAAYEDGNEEDSLQALQKALNDESSDELFKAKGGNGEESEEEEKEEEKGEYDESYMKKHMPRYMKENKKAVECAAKRMGIFSDKMNKAFDDIDSEAEGAVVEMVDLKPALESIQEGFGEMEKAFVDIANTVLLISEQNQKTYDIMKKAANAQVDQAKNLDEFLGKSNGRKGLTVDANLKKGEEIVVDGDGNKVIYDLLLKATKEGDQTAGMVLSAFESRGKNANNLNAAQKKYANELLQKREAK